MGARRNVARWGRRTGRVRRRGTQARGHEARDGGQGS